MKFIYSEIKLRTISFQTKYTFQDEEEGTLLRLLNIIGEDGWEFIGFFEGKYLVKKAVPADQ